MSKGEGTAEPGVGAGFLPHFHVYSELVFPLLLQKPLQISNALHPSFTCLLATPLLFSHESVSSHSCYMAAPGSQASSPPGFPDSL